MTATKCSVFALVRCIQRSPRFIGHIDFCGQKQILITLLFIILYIMYIIRPTKSDGQDTVWFDGRRGKEYVNIIKLQSFLVLLQRRAAEPFFPSTTTFVCPNVFEVNKCFNTSTHSKDTKHDWRRVPKSLALNSHLDTLSAPLRLLIGSICH